MPGGGQFLEAFLDPAAAHLGRGGDPLHARPRDPAVITRAIGQRGQDGLPSRVPEGLGVCQPEASEPHFTAGVGEWFPGSRPRLSATGGGAPAAQRELVEVDRDEHVRAARRPTPCCVRPGKRVGATRRPGQGSRGVTRRHAASRLEEIARGLPVSPRQPSVGLGGARGRNSGDTAGTSPGGCPDCSWPGCGPGGPRSGSRSGR